MINLSKEQLVQEEQYEFPYHYIPQSTPHFTSGYTWGWGIYYISAIDFVLNYLKGIEFQSIIDVGTGDGRLVKELNREFPGKRILGVDYSKYAINLAKALNPSFDFRCVDIFSEGLDEKFDCVALIEVFEHIPICTARAFANRLAEIVKKGGNLIITVPHINKPIIDKHFQHFSKENLYQYYESNFELVEVTHIQSRGFLSWILRILLINPLFVLNSRLVKDWIYRIYMKHCFVAKNTRSERLFMHLRRK